MSKWIIALWLCAWSLISNAVDVKTYIPKKAPLVLPIVQKEINQFMPGIQYPEYFGGLIEQESCLSLTHSRCFDPRSELKSAREQGVGVGQITRAFNSNGTVRFDSLTDMKNRHKSELSEANWDTISSRTDIQVRLMILMTRDNNKQFTSIQDELVRFQFNDAAYNGGAGGVQKERRYCGLKADCDPNIWFGHVELNCLKSKKPLYGTQTACSINRDHVRNVFKLRMNKYKAYLK